MVLMIEPGISMIARLLTNTSMLSKIKQTKDKLATTLGLILMALGVMLSIWGGKLISKPNKNADSGNTRKD